MRDIVYVVQAYKFGCRDRHGYLVGVCETLERALELSNQEEECRGGKYSCQVLECVVDHGAMWQKVPDEFPVVRELVKHPSLTENPYEVDA